MILGRRQVLAGSAAAMVFARSALAQEASPPTSTEVAKMAEAAEGFRKQHEVPGLAVAFTHAGKLVHEAAFGLADRDAGEALTPRHRFRIASVSKPITAVAIFRLIEEGKLRLGDRVLGPDGILGETYGKVESPRLRAITVDHLLTHTSGGWPNDATDPMFRAGLPEHAALIEATLAYQAPAHDPGTHYAYSNFGYCLLGRVIERVSGEPYAGYVKQTLLAPSGIADMEIAGNTLAERQPPEVRYYAGPHENAYGMDVRRMDSHGGWIASAASLARFAAAVPSLLKPETVSLMTTASPINPAYARGWRVNARGNTWHTGSLPGTATIMVRTTTGLTWAALCNTRSRESELARDLDRVMWTMARAVPRWRA